MTMQLAPKHLQAALLAVLTLGAALGACGPRAEDAAQETTPPPTASPATQADGLLPLPALTPCASTDHPLLPAKWESEALLQDFFLNTYLVGKFVYDEGAKAFRFSLNDQYGIDADFLVTTDRKLYLLEGGEQPTSCTYLTASSPFTVPARDWLNTGAVCVGQAPILQRDQQWWKSPSGVGANWFWYDSTSKMPFRNMFYAEADPADPVPIYEYFTFNYFPNFREVKSTNLGQLVSMCQKDNPIPTATQEYSRLSVDPILQKSAYPKVNAERAAQIEARIPGLTPCSSTGALPPQWPDQVQLTAFMTAVSFEPNPFPTRVFYDWTKKAQNSTLNYFPQTPENGSQKALLLGDTGYIAMVRQDGTVSSCAQALPGPQTPNWKQVDGCECRGQIAPRTVLNPSDVPTKILWCPTDLSAQQVFWTWYSDTGTPVVFMQSNSSPTAGTGLNLADYTGWQPGSVAPSGTFDLPEACKGQPVVEVPKACHNCHLPLNAKKAS